MATNSEKQWAKGVIGTALEQVSLLKDKIQSAKTKTDADDFTGALNDIKASSNIAGTFDDRQREAQTALTVCAG